MLNSETYKYSSKTNHCCGDRSEYGGGEVMRALLPNPENLDRSEGVAVSCGGGASNAGGLPSPGVCDRCTAAGGPDQSFEEAEKFSVSSGSELPLLKM
jgi:hypothetical protein